MKLLLTGSTGFLGSHVAKKLLAQNHEIHCVIRESSDTAYLQQVCSDEASVTNIIKVKDSFDNLYEKIQPIKFDGCIHIAAAPGGGRNEKVIRQQINANILFGSLILNAAFDAGARFIINTGTSWQNINGTSYSPFDFYAATKQAFQGIVDDYVAAGMKAITLQLFDVYGENDPRPKIMNLFRRIAESGEILDMSPGDQKVDLVHVSDVVEAFVRAIDICETLTAGDHRIYCVSGGEPTPLKTLALEYEERHGVKLNINWGGRDYRPREVMEPKSPFQNILTI